MTRAELPERIETERLVLRVRTVADAEDIFDYASRPEVSYPAGFPPVKSLEDEIYYLEHILPERNEKENLPAGYGIIVKGTDTIIGSVDFPPSLRRRCAGDWLYLAPGLLGSRLYTRSSACLD